MQFFNRYLTIDCLESFGQNTMNGFGNGGEGFSLKKLPDGRRIIFN
jgi:hypothetical protein